MRLFLFRHLFEALFADGGVEGDAEEDLADFAVVAGIKTQRHAVEEGKDIVDLEQLLDAYRRGLLREKR